MMEKIVLHDKTFKPFIPYAKLEAAIDSVARRINADYEGSKDIPILLCILNGSVMFTAELMKRLDFDLQLVSMKLSSYSGTQSSGVIKQVMGLTSPVKGRRVIIVEDIVDTGVTINSLKTLLYNKGAHDVKVVTLLDKPSRRQVDVKADYIGFEVENEFVVGFGLDYNQKYRNLPYIGVLKEELY